MVNLFKFNFMMSYIRNILICSEDINLYLRYLKVKFNIIHNHDLTINIKKFVFYIKTYYFDFKTPKGFYYLLQERADEILKFPSPTTLKNTIFCKISYLFEVLCFRHIF